MRRQWSLSAERGSRRDFRTGLTLARWIDHGRSISVACSRGTEFVQKHPVATKCALRAILKAADLCARETERVARFIVDKGFTPTYDHALQTIKALPYGKWRDYDAEDTVRFYALRLKEVGMIKSSPQRIITQGTD